MRRLVEFAPPVFVQPVMAPIEARLASCRLERLPSSRLIQLPSHPGVATGSVGGCPEHHGEGGGVIRGYTSVLGLIDNQGGAALVAWNAKDGGGRCPRRAAGHWHRSHLPYGPRPELRWYRLICQRIGGIHNPNPQPVCWPAGCGWWHWHQVQTRCHR